MTAMATAPTTYFTVVLDQAKEDLARRGLPIFDFGVGDPIEPTPSFIRQALIEALDPVSQYPTIVGQRRLRQSIAGWAERRLAIKLDPDTQILPAAGSKEAIFHTPLAVIGTNETRRRIVYPSPSYPVYEGSARFSGCIPHPVPLREDNGYRLELLELGQDILRQTRIAWLTIPTTRRARALISNTCVARCRSPASTRFCYAPTTAISTFTSATSHRPASCK